VDWDSSILRGRGDGSNRPYAAHITFDTIPGSRHFYIRSPSALAFGSIVLTSPQEYVGDEMQVHIEAAHASRELLERTYLCRNMYDASRLNLITLYVRIIQFYSRANIRPYEPTRHQYRLPLQTTTSYSCRIKYTSISQFYYHQHAETHCSGPT
jgi:hypothetical protein